MKRSIDTVTDLTQDNSDVTEVIDLTQDVTHVTHVYDLTQYVTDVYDLTQDVTDHQWWRNDANIYHNDHLILLPAQVPVQVGSCAG